MIVSSGLQFAYANGARLHFPDVDVPQGGVLLLGEPLPVPARVPVTEPVRLAAGERLTEGLPVGLAPPEGVRVAAGVALPVRLRLR